jgi:heterodisulfide reductase subunit B2
MRQEQINKKYGTKLNIPVLYITQLIGLALDIPVKDLGMNSHFVSPAKILKILNSN